MSIAAAFLICARCALAEAVNDAGVAHFIYFSGGDLWRNGGFLHGGVLWSPDGLDRDGLIVKAMISGGSYRYISGALGNAEVDGRELAAQLLGGWRFIRGKTELKLFAGLDLQNHRLSPDDPSSSLRGGDVGVRIAFELWNEPSPQTMLAADGSLSSIGTNYSLRAAAGWRINDLFYIGPEAQTFATDDYRQVRVGAHVTGLKTGAFEWSAGAGFAHDSDRRDGTYVRLGVLTRR
jgi:hypothetical protein